MYMSFSLKGIYWSSIYVLIFMTFLYTGKVFVYDSIQNIKYAEIQSNLTTQAIRANLAEMQKPKKITLLAVGDIMMHESQLTAGYEKESKTYNFSEYFKYVNSYLKEGNIVYANLETPIAGEKLKYSGYPRFNAPNELLLELKNNYFTHLSLANNHSLDQGSLGLSNTIKNVSDFGFVGLGARDDILKPNYEITEKNGMRIGFLSYSYGENGFTLPEDKSFMLSHINKEQIVKDLEELKNQNVDIVVTAFHFGQEYKLQEDESQKEIANLACTNGANIVLGTHPHVLEPTEFTNEGKCLVAYSLGNFISGMSNLYTDLGGILKIEITKENENISIIPEFMGTWVKRGYDEKGIRYFSVIPLSEDKIPEEVKITNVEQKKLETYRNFVETKIKNFTD